MTESVDSLTRILSGRLVPLAEPVPQMKDLRHAAVVALLTDHHAGGPGPGLVLIERAAALRNHAGQIALPGGLPEANDESLWHTAAREAGEEVGLSGDVQPLGRLGPVPTPSGFLVIPFVARAPSGWAPTRASEQEVERVLQPSVATLLDPSVHRISGQVSWNGRSYDMHEFAIADPPLWGATARMVWDLVTRIRRG